MRSQRGSTNGGEGLALIGLFIMIAVIPLAIYNTVQLGLKPVQDDQARTQIVKLIGPINSLLRDPPGQEGYHHVTYKVAQGEKTFSIQCDAVFLSDDPNCYLK